MSCIPACALQEPPVHLLVAPAVKKKKGTTAGDTSYSDFEAADCLHPDSEKFIQAAHKEEKSWIVQSTIGPIRITQLIPREFSGVTEVKCITPTNSLRMFLCNRWCAPA